MSSGNTGCKTVIYTERLAIHQSTSHTRLILSWGPFRAASFYYVMRMYDKTQLEIVIILYLLYLYNSCYTLSFEPEPGVHT